MGGGATFGGGGAANGGNVASGGGASAVAYYNGSNSNLTNMINNNTVMIIAGGGGGIGENTRGDVSYVRYKHGTRIGNGGGGGVYDLYDDGGSSNHEPSERARRFVYTWGSDSAIYGSYASSGTTQYERGTSGAVNGAGSGGGGYYGGGGGREYSTGGAGGEAYIDSNKLQSYTAANGQMWKMFTVNGGVSQGSQFRTGNGYVKITYIEHYKVSITINIGNKGGYGSSDALVKKELYYPCDSTNVQLLDITPVASIQFQGYDIINGEITINRSKHTANIGMDNIVLEAKYTSTGMVLNGSLRGDKKTLDLTWTDHGAHYYSVWTSTDTDGLKESDYNNLCDSYVLGVDSAVENIDINGIEKTITTEGLYLVELRGEKGQANSSTSTKDGGSGAIHSAYMFFNIGDKLKTTQTRGGYGAQSSKIPSERSGSGGRSLNLYVNGTPVMSAGGGGGAGACCHWQYHSGGWHTHYGAQSGGSSTGITSDVNIINSCMDAVWNYERYEVSDAIPEGYDIWWLSGGSGGGYINRGGLKTAGPAGESYLAPQVNGMPTNSIGNKHWIAGTQPSFSTGYLGGSSSLYGSIKLIGLLGVTADTNGTYELKDNKPPTIPEEGNAGGCTINEDNRQYTIMWKESTDQGSLNTFVVNSFNSSRVQLSQKTHLETYTSGLAGYRYIVDTNPSTTVTTTNGTVINASSYQAERSIKVDASYLRQYVHIAAFDHAGNISGTLTIAIPGDKLIVYDNNIGTSNRYGDAYSSTPTGQIYSQKLKDGESANVLLNFGSILRTGYMHKLEDVNGSLTFTYNTKPDGTGRTYHAGDKVSYADIPGAILTLYVIWEPNLYEIRLNKNTPTDATHDVQVNSSLSSGWVIGDGDDGNEYYKRTFRYDQSSIKVPATSFYTLTGWHQEPTEQEWYKTKGLNGSASDKLNWVGKWNISSTHLDVLMGYVKWSKNRYRIHYNGNNTAVNIYNDPTSEVYTGVVPDTSCLYDTDVTLRDGHEFSKTGYLLKEWNTKSDATGTSFKLGDTLTKPNLVEADHGEITLYAIWEPIRYDIAFNNNHGTTHRGAGDYDSTWQMETIKEVRYDQTITLPDNEYIRKYWVEFRNGEPWIKDKQDENGTINSASKWVYYTFMGWKQNTATGSSPYYEVPDSTGLFSNKQSVKNLTTVDKSTQTLYASWKGTTVKPPTSVTGSDRWTFIDWSDKPYIDDRLYDKSVHDGKDKNNAVVKKNTDYKPSEDILIYAHWSRDVSLTLDFTGGIYLDKTGQITLVGTQYDYEDGYSFRLDDSLTAQVKGRYDQQIGNIDAYGTYDANGINNKYRKFIDGVQYRLLGWSPNRDSLEPDWDSCVYNASHITSYNVKDNTTIYAIWEPVLNINFTMDRSLGTLQYDGGGEPKVTLQNITAVTENPLVVAIIRPGEEGTYTTATKNTGVTGATVFDTRITQMYTVPGTWTDSLNPSTEENLEPNQPHGLNRRYTVTGEVTSRKFHIPEYLGSKDSYIGNEGITTYNAVFRLQKPSYYWTKIKGKDAEIIDVTGIIHISTKPSSGLTDISTVLDDLRTELRVRMQN